MTLDEAIAHAKEMGMKMMCKQETCSCGKEHLQLAKWLEELREYKCNYALPSANALSAT